jgi:hypothetical protein
VDWIHLAQSSSLQVDQRMLAPYQVQRDVTLELTYTRHCLKMVAWKKNCWWMLEDEERMLPICSVAVGTSYIGMPLLVGVRSEVRESCRLER